MLIPYHQTLRASSLFFNKEGASEETRFYSTQHEAIGIGPGKALILYCQYMTSPLTLLFIDKDNEKTIRTDIETAKSWGLARDNNGGVIAYVNHVIPPTGPINPTILRITDEEITSRTDFPYGKEIIRTFSDHEGGEYYLYIKSELGKRVLYSIYLKNGEFSEETRLIESVDSRAMIEGIVDSDNELKVIIQRSSVEEFVLNQESAFFSIKGSTATRIDLMDGIPLLLFGLTEYSFETFLEENSLFLILQHMISGKIYIFENIEESIYIFPQPLFLRGDASNDGIRNIADAVRILGYLFLQGDAKPKVSCLDTLDANDDGIINIADAVKLLGHLFSNTGPLPEPFGAVGRDPTEDTIGCGQYGN